MILVRDLFVEHGGTEAVRGVSLELSDGAAVAVVGPSGCGKTSLILAISRLLPDSSRVRGEVLMNGTSVELIPSAVLRKKLAVVFQEPGLALDPIMRVGKQLAEIDRGRVVEILKSAGFADPESIARSFPHQLSGGMRQRVLIAMALMRDPEVLLLDEPTAQLDAITKQEISALLAERRRALGMSMLYVTHDLELASSMCERVLEMRDGRLA